MTLNLVKIDTLTGESQKTINWLYRTGFFVLVGTLSGTIMSCLKVQVEAMRHVIAMAHSLGISSVAEGVEDEQAVEILHIMGCPVDQGYFF